MRYISTRGAAPPVSFLDAVLAGLAPDGGLYVPESWPALDLKPSDTNSHYSFAAYRVLAAFSGDEIGYDDGGLATLATDAYIDPPSVAQIEAGEPWRNKWPNAVAPLRQLGAGNWLLELFHGPSLSFKDVAMQLIGPLYDFALAKRDRRLTVLCATSGDTGGAAVEALKSRERVDLFVLTPKGRVSDVQRRFMTSSGAPNVHVIEIEGDFDVCQAIVKTLFADGDYAARAQLSGVNSINWARIVAQSVYFHLSAHALSAAGSVNFVVPTGNMGDAYSGWVAKQMGAPIGRIVVATNANDIIVRALETGRYARGASKATLSPAMDIQVASNFERILYAALGRDSEALARLYASFAQSGGFDIPPDALARLREDFGAGAVTDAQTTQVMANYAQHENLLVCPHTATGLWAPHHPGSAPTVHLATAHPAKFPETAEHAT
ncbi:MAG TPA: threonine synthase, partial [Terricaulis sp.]|nr:threonine synthase [Terricaulis sp.]